MSTQLTKFILNKLDKHQGAGIKGFEGLIAQLLEALTGRHFLLAKSGSQEGRDLSSSDAQSNNIAVECKRYGKTTELNERELLGELEQAKTHIVDLDIWILVTTRDVDSQLFESLRKKSLEDGLDFLTIADGDGIPSSLEVLCANSQDIFIKFFQNTVSLQDIQKIEIELIQIAQNSEFNPKKLALRTRLLSPLIGYDNWRICQNKEFLESIESDIKSHSKFNQVLNVKDKNTKIINRNDLYNKLNEWFLNWKNNKSFFVILGEEGDGKTWGLAHWLGEKIEQIESFPPVLFLSSSQILIDDPYHLICNVIKPILKLSEQYCRKRLERWLKRTIEDFPLFILVLDGINERHDNRFWRQLSTKLSDTDWINNVAIVITCRTKYWEENFADLKYLNCTKYTILPYSDDELIQALKYHSLNRSDIPDSLLPLIRKPRYFDLMVKHREKMSESGDFTIARLIYEDWKDRYTKKTSTQFNNDDFNDFIQNLASKIIEEKRKTKYLFTREIEDNLSFVTDKIEFFNNLRTGGILEKLSSDKFKVKSEFLTYGFGLLLVSKLIEGQETDETNLQEIMAQWIEPLAEMEVKAEICHFASLIALEEPNCSESIKVLLLLTWINSQNPSLDSENDFINYLPCSPQSYIKLAEKNWSESCYNSWGQELLMRAFLKWHENKRVLIELYPALEKWLGFIHLDGFSNQRNLYEKDHQVRQDIRERIGFDLKIGDLLFYGYHLTVVEDDGLLQLGRFALALISCLPRASCIKAIVTGYLAEVIMGFPQRYDLFAWIIRSSPTSLWTEIETNIKHLQNTDNNIALKVVHGLLSFDGSVDAYTIQQTLPSDLFPHDPWKEKHKYDPCTSFLAWNKEECEICIRRDDLDPHLIASRIQSHYINPDLDVPDNLKHNLSPLLNEISIDSIWSSQYNDISEILFERYEPVFYLCSPEIIANFVRKIIQGIAKREGIQLRQLCFQIVNHIIIVKAEQEISIYQAWEKFSKEITGENILDRIAESVLFQSILKNLDSNQQLEYLLQRPKYFSDSLLFQSRFKPLTKPEIALNKISKYTDEKSLQRFLWFFGANQENLSSQRIDKYIYPLLKSQDSFTRSLVLEIIYHFKDIRSIENFINTSWQWSLNHCDLENHWGSLLLMDYAQNLSFSDLKQRIHPVYLGQAINNRGMKDLEIKQYKETLCQHWNIINNNVSELAVDFPYIEVSISENKDFINLESVILSDKNFNRNISFINQALTWGGWPERNSKKINDFQNVEQSNELRGQLGQVITETIKKQIEQGNYYFCSVFSNKILKKVIDCDSTIVDLWIEPINSKQGKSLQKIIDLSSTFYDILCLTLLEINHHSAIKLYDFLIKIKCARKIRLVFSPSNIDFLDYALFQGSPTEIIKKEWQKRVESCCSDLELMEKVLIIQQSNRLDWLKSYIEQKLEANTPLYFSLAVTILGFIDVSYGSETLDQINKEQPDTWRKQLVNLSLNRWKKNTWAKYWFKNFLDSTDSVLAWRNFRLFLRCVDRRFWLWKKQLIDEVGSIKYLESRLSFLKDNTNTIENAIGNNEKELEKYFLGYQIFNRQVSPWL